MPARTKLVITLSDGKPDDYTGYRGEYGIEDIRVALFETRRSGLHPFCVTLDDKGADYPAYMYGAANFAVTSEAKMLPAKVSEVYRKLTC